MRKQYEISAVDRIITDQLASREMIEAIIEAVKASISETSQRANVTLADAAESVIELFKKGLREAIVQSSNDWLAQNGDIQVVPPNTKLFKKIGNYQVCVVEQPPTIRSLNFDNERLQGGAKGSFSLALPYVVFTVWAKNGAFCNAFIGYAVKPLVNIKDVIFAPNLPNIHVGLNICMGRVFTDRVAIDFREGKIKPIAVIVDEAIGHFWSSVFNNDLGDYYSRATRFPQVASVKQWQENTLEDPLFMLKIPWDQKFTLNQFLNPESDGISIKVGPIVDRAINQACTKITNQFSVLGENIATGRASSVFKARVYEQLTKACFNVLDKVSVHQKKEWEEEVRRQLAAKGPSLEEEGDLARITRFESGDYLYHPPKYGVW